jgi:hypothetical protein
MRNKNSNKIAFYVILAGVLLIVLVTIISRNKPTQVDLGDNTVQTNDQVDATDSGDDIVEAEGELVDGFPDFPIYPGAELEKSNQSTYQGRTAYSGTWISTGTVQKVMAWYRDQAKQKNWEIIDDPSNPASGQEQHLNLNVDGQLINVTVELEDNQTKPEIIIDVLPQ